jgi:uncharacterized membrane protein YraQ (UPF0718 family)
MIESVFWGAVTRGFQVIVYSTLWVALGFFVAAVFRVIVGSERTRRLFGGPGWKGLALGWLWGMLLPICSLGAIPVVRELHRAGVRGGTLIAFALTVPLFNPLSILYGLTLSDPIAILTFAFCTLVIVSTVGMLWDRWMSAADETEIIDDPPMDYGLKRMVALFHSTTGMLFGTSMIYILVGVAGSVIVSVFLPHGAMSTMLERDNLAAPIIVAGLGLPIYSTPLLAMSQIGSMFQHGNSIGAAFSLLIFGAGINLGIVWCFFRLFGVRRVLAFLSLLALISLGIAYLISEPLFPKGVEVAGHTHAFDVYTNPFASSGNYQAMAMSEIKRHWRENELGGTFLLAALVLVGLTFKSVERFFDLHGWYQSKSEKLNRDFVLPDSVIATVSISVLLIFSVAGCYVYYPPTLETLEQMQAANLDVHEARLARWETAMRGIEAQTAWSRSLEVGTFLRTGRLSEYHRVKAQILRDRLEHLRHAVEDQDLESAKHLVRQADIAYRRLARAYRSDGE